MNEWIMDMARGEFRYKNQRLVLPEHPITIQVEAGKVANGSFMLHGEKGTPVKGVLRHTDRNMQFMQDYFVGTNCTVAFTYSAKYLAVGEVVKGRIQITSDCGEYDLPYAVHVEAPSYETSIGKIRDLNSFSNLAKDYTEEAVRIFKSKDFESVFLYRDNVNAMLYEALLEGPLPSQAMEEFLIATRKKVRIRLEIDKGQFTYKDCEKKFMDKVVLHKNTWGYTEIRIASDAEFLIPERKILWTDGFIGNSYSLEFTVDPNLMHKGNNFGRITIQTVQQSLTVEVSAALKKTEPCDAVKYRRRMAMHGITRNYLAFRLNKIGRVEYVSQMEDLLRLYGEALEEGLVPLIRAHTAFTDGKEKEARAFIKDREGKDTLEGGESLVSVLAHAGTLYLKALLSKEEEDVKEAASQIGWYYENGYMDWKVLWFLLYVDKKYDKEGVRLEAILSHLREGCSSPVLYFEAFAVYNASPERLRELNKENLAIMKWGITKGLCTEELALRFTYQAGRVKWFHPVILHCLELIYERFELKDALHAICSLLIRSEKTERKYFKWFQMGVEKQLRITDIYEYFLYTINEWDEVELPQSLLHYFLYDNHLNDKKKALYYARIVKEKGKNPLNYNNYRNIIGKFARGQLEAKNISESLATIYEDMVMAEALDDGLARMLPDVMFQYEITCVNPNMAGVCVVHKEMGQEAYVPFAGGKAQVGIYTENAKILLVDKKGNRYVETMDYTENKLLHLDDLATACYAVSNDNPKLRLFVFVKTESHYPINRDNVNIYKDALRDLPLRDQYKRKNCNALIQYCYDNAEGEILNELLEDLDVAMADPRERVLLAEFYMMREMYPKALAYIKKYGYEGIDLYRLGKLCTHMLLLSEDEQDGELLRLCHYLFTKIQYSEPILEYLISDFEGNIQEMLDVWKVSESFRIDRRLLEERILIQMLYTGDLVMEGIPVYESYVEKGENRQLRKAYLSYLAYQNITSHISLPTSIYDIMRKSVIYEENKACMLALLKYYSAQHELGEKERGFVDYNLTKFLEEDFFLPFFLDYDGKIPLPSKLRNVCMVDYVGDPDVPVTIRYRIDGDDKEYEEHMKNMIYGIYIKTSVLFRDESLSYRIFIRMDGELREVKSGVLKPPGVRREKVESNFLLLNEMLTAKEEKDSARLCESMERYVKRQYVMEKLFQPTP